MSRPELLRDAGRGPLGSPGTSADPNNTSLPIRTPGPQGINDANSLLNHSFGGRQLSDIRNMKPIDRLHSGVLCGNSVKAGSVKRDGKTFWRTGDIFERRIDAVVAGAHHAYRQSAIIEWGWVVYRVGNCFGFVWFEGTLLGTDFGEVPFKILPKKSIIVATGHTHQLGLPDSDKDIRHSRKVKEVFGAATYIIDPDGTYQLLPNGKHIPVPNEKAILRRLKSKGLMLK